MLRVNSGRLAVALAGLALLTPLAAAAVAYADAPQQPAAPASVAPAERVVDVMTAHQETRRDLTGDPALPVAGGVLGLGTLAAVAAGAVVVRKR